mmetsp:Transcript_62131/g.148073  ORF Transcript_62131/g.148073 Transcript_62131/m.148073 type:complete len:469 (+) Transcript_62131:161-1567(+)
MFRLLGLLPWALAEEVCVELLQTRLRLQQRYHQELRNEGDTTYSALVRCGQQDVQAILDTGSYELVIFAEGCEGCGTASEGSYNPERSSTFQEGSLLQLVSYGSGDTLCRDGIDRLDVGPLSVQQQPVWLVQEASMDILQGAGFQAILGMGPPNAIRDRARAELQELEKLKREAEAWGVVVPARLRSRMEDSEQANLIMEDLEDSVPGNLQVRFWSVCLGKAPSSPGHAVWNDLDPAERAALGFRRLAVAGSLTWGFQLRHVALKTHDGRRLPVACEEGCSAILDTGTSLLAAPSGAVAKVGQLLAELKANCLDQDSLPSLELELGGQLLSLPSQAFMGFVVGAMPVPWKRTFGQKTFIQVEACELLMMDTGAALAEHGALWIIGMPFFRKYYTTFDYGSSDDQSTASVWVAEADAACEPRALMLGQASADGSSEERAQSWLSVDQGRLRLPAWMANRTNRSDSLVRL